jgi:hypothetical protein
LPNAINARPARTKIRSGLFFLKKRLPRNPVFKITIFCDYCRFKFYNYFKIHLPGVFELTRELNIVFIFFFRISPSKKKSFFFHGQGGHFGIVKKQGSGRGSVI